MLPPHLPLHLLPSIPLLPLQLLLQPSLLLLLSPSLVLGLPLGPLSLSFLQQHFLVKPAVFVGGVGGIIPVSFVDQLVDAPDTFGADHELVVAPLDLRVNGLDAVLPVGLGHLVEVSLESACEDRRPGPVNFLALDLPH